MRQTYDKAEMSSECFLQLTYDNHNTNHTVPYQ